MKRLIIALLAITLVGGSSCNQTQKPITPIKNVILMIGDGMGPQQVSQAIYHRRLNQKDQPKLSFEKLYESSQHAIALTNSANAIVTDSAAGATALACGKKTLNDVVGKDEKGFNCETILEFAKKQGKSTGLVSTTRFTHATPAAFAAHNIARGNEAEISTEMLLTTKPDLILSGGLRYLISKDQKASQLKECHQLSKRLDGNGKMTQSILPNILKEGYQLACHKDQLNKIKSGRVLGLFSNSVFPFVQERNKIPSIPTLAELTEYSLNHLSKNKKGFFVMIEAGLIDYAGHANDAGTMLQETLDFDLAIHKAMDFVDQNPNTLLIVTADHETGGFGYSYRRWLKKSPQIQLESKDVYEPRYLPAPHDITQMGQNQKIDSSSLYYKIKDIKDPEMAKTKLNTLLEKNYDLKLPSVYLDYIFTKNPSPDLFDNLHDHGVYRGGYPSAHFETRLNRALRSINFATFATGNHTATPVDVFVYGQTQQTIPQLIDNTDVFGIMKNAYLNKSFESQQMN